MYNPCFKWPYTVNRYTCLFSRGCIPPFIFPIRGPLCENYKLLLSEKSTENGNRSDLECDGIPLRRRLEHMREKREQQDVRRRTSTYCRAFKTVSKMEILGRQWWIFPTPIQSLKAISPKTSFKRGYNPSKCGFWPQLPICFRPL